MKINACSKCGNIENEQLEVSKFSWSYGDYPGMKLKGDLCYPCAQDLTELLSINLNQ